VQPVGPFFAAVFLSEERLDMREEIPVAFLVEMSVHVETKSYFLYCSGEQALCKRAVSREKKWLWGYVIIIPICYASD
jgi:hypothetical protein